jgi:Na+/melibiose symporter-like transporter
MESHNGLNGGLKHNTNKGSRLSNVKIASFGMIMFASAALNNIFVSYYIELFCFVLDMDSAWFFISQFVFMIWNASNDPLFGYLSDVILMNGADEARRRIDSIRWGGLLWCVAFVTVWFPPSRESTGGESILGIYFMFCLCFYDGLLTFVEVNHSALLAEIGTNIKDRARCNLASAGFATIGSITSYFGYFFWNREDLTSFRRLCLVVAVMSAAAFQISATMMYRGDDINVSKESHKRQNGKTKKKKKKDTKTNLFGLLRVVNDFSRNSNARIYGGVNFLQCFDCTFQKNFFPFFLTYFARGRLNSKVRYSLSLSLSIYLLTTHTHNNTNLNFRYSHSSSHPHLCFLGLPHHYTQKSWKHVVCSEHCVPCLICV